MCCLAMHPQEKISRTLDLPTVCEHPTPSTLKHTPYLTLNPKFEMARSSPCTVKARTRFRRVRPRFPQTLNPKPQTLNPKP